ncbi:MAG: tetrahydrofolate dehydrogenase/cyclohydrolase catalytic domain-containing protein, partial [Candidatus Omnitrophota bacterium]
MAKLLEGNPIAEKIKEELKKQVQPLKPKPVLASIMVGENAGATSYVKSQSKAAENLGIEYRLLKLPQDIAEDAL